MNDSIDDMLAVATELLSPFQERSAITQPAPERLDVALDSPEDLIPVTAALRVKRLGYLSAITGLDLGPEAGELEVLYHYCSGPVIITLRLRVPREGAVVPTLIDLIPSAEPYERELSEMFGIHVDGLRVPVHLYLPEDWPAGVYPLRKDFDPAVLREQATERRPS
jgi:NADH:ubiquinone oxidoreductase subunit C